MVDFLMSTGWIVLKHEATQTRPVRATQFFLPPWVPGLAVAAAFTWPSYWRQMMQKPPVWILLSASCALNRMQEQQIHRLWCPTAKLIKSDQADSLVFASGKYNIKFSKHDSKWIYAAAWIIEDNRVCILRVKFSIANESTKCHHTFWP